MPGHQPNQLGDIGDIDMIAPFLAFTEQHDLFACGGKPAETVGAVSIVRIGGAVDQRRAKDGERTFDGVLQHQFPSEVHHAMQ